MKQICACDRILSVSRYYSGAISILDFKPRSLAQYLPVLCSALQLCERQVRQAGHQHQLGVYQMRMRQVGLIQRVREQIAFEVHLQDARQTSFFDHVVQPRLEPLPESLCSLAHCSIWKGLNNYFDKFLYLQ